MSRMVGEKDLIICDLDGTIALDEHRVHLIRDPNNRQWEPYFQACGLDEPNWPVIELLQDMYDMDYRIYIFSGRSESVRGITEEWLKRHAVRYESLVMRPVDSREQDHEMKIRWAEEANLKRYVKYVLEDRHRVVEAWRKAGYPCFQVAPGNF